MHPSFAFSWRYAAITILLTAFSILFSTLAFGQKLTVLHTFNSTDGQFPDSGLVHGSDGNLYGTSSSGGAHGFGTVFKVTPSGKFTSIYSFAGGTGDGTYPESSVIRDSTGNIYGMTPSGGPADNIGGVVFKITSSGRESVLHAFTAGADGGRPVGDLIRDSSGNLYGLTSFGGDTACVYDNFAVGCGVAFKLDSTGNETVLHTFEGGLDGAGPEGGLVMDSAGNLYGTTQFGGQYGAGQIFKINRSGRKTVVHDFDPGFHQDGSNPRYGLTFAPGGIMYGITPTGGDVSLSDPIGNGIVFKVDTHNTVTTIYSFKGLPLDGYVPDGPVARDAAGNLYGTTAGGGLNDAGTVYKLDSSGNETILHNFTAGTDGWEPGGRLYVDGSGTVFGTASLSSDIDGYGVIFKITQ
jgi:uncharacterized repeat protein (TIGR03803 family)